MGRTVIVGPGAMGRLHAALLAKAGVDVVLLDYRPERAKDLRERGVVLRHASGEEHVALSVMANPEEVGPADLVVLMVKAYSTEWAARHVLAAATDETVWATLQNGLGNIESIRRVVPSAVLVAGVTTTGANLAADGSVNIAAVGGTIVGPIETASLADAQRLSVTWQQAGLACEVVPDPWPTIWRKLVVNAAINPIAGLAGRPNGDVVEVDHLWRLAAAVAREVASVARAEAVDLGAGFDPVEAVAEVCRLTATNRCSLLQDLVAGRRTEIDYINGEVAKRASPEASAPLCEALTTLVEAAEAQHSSSADPEGN